MYHCHHKLACGKMAFREVNLRFSGDVVAALVDAAKVFRIKFDFGRRQYAVLIDIKMLNLYDWLMNLRRWMTFLVL